MCCSKNLLPVGVSYDQLSKDAKTRVDHQTLTVHGLPFEPYTAYNRREFLPYHQMRDYITRWCQQYLTLERWRLGVVTLNGLYRLFQELRFSYPIVVLEGQGCRDLASLPTATVNVMATNDHGRNWCADHSHGERGSGIWHNHCARVRVCQMSGWLRRQSKVLPTLSQVNAQRVLWQKRCDRLLDHLLCNYCNDPKDEAFARGQGLEWIPDNCCQCRSVLRIFEQTVIYWEWQEPLMYADEEPHTMWAWNPCPKTAIINADFFSFFPDNAADYLHGRRQRRGHACGTFMSPVCSFVCGPHPTLSPSSQVPRTLNQPDLDAATPTVTQVAFRLDRHVSHPITLQYLQRNYYVIRPASLVLVLGYFDELRKHVLGGTGWSVAMAQIFGKPLYVFDLNWNSGIGGIPPYNTINPVKA